MSDTNAAEKLFIGIQLIVENVDEVRSKNYVTSGMRNKLNNMKIQSEKLLLEFWDQLPPDAEILFNKKVSKVEKALL